MPNHVSSRVKSPESRAEARFEALAESAPIGIFHTTREGRVDYANPAWMDMADCDYHDADAARRAIHPEDQPSLAARWHDAMAQGSTLDAEFRFLHADGTIVYCRTRASPMKDVTGSISGFVGTVEDVTERARAEKEADRVRRQDALLTDARDQLGEGVAILDLATKRLVLANPAQARLTGYSLEELMERSADELLAPLAAAQNGHSGPSESVLVAKDGRRVPVEVVMKTFEEAGRSYAIVVSRDLTERLQAQALRAQADAHLREVARLRETDEFKLRFLNVAAHELKTPLTPIRLQLRLLESYLGGATEEIQSSLGILVRNVDRLSGLINDVLDASRIQASQLSVRAEPTSLSAIVAEACQTWSAVAREVGVDLVYHDAPNVNVMGDPSRLVQVVNNLISNAIKFTPEGGSVEARVRSDGGWATLVVRDSGRGMTKEQIVRLFQPFTQVHPELEATKKGTGLGLYITKAIVAHHGGTIAVESPGPNQGTQVSVRLHTTDERPTARVVSSPAAMRPLRTRLREMV
ncbi:MAG: sensor histidine kinase [Thermoplasmatota archaeon]